MRGFAGVGGPKWIASVLADRTPATPEDLSPADVAPSDCAFAEVSGRPVIYRALGAGDTAICFIHGFGESLRIWEPIQTALAATHRTVALDLWGFGASVRPNDITPRDWIGEATGLLDALGIERAVFVGHSLGGRVSLMCARHAPERVAGLVLCDADWGQAPHGYLLAWALCRTPSVGLLLGKLRANPEHLTRLLTVFGTPSFNPDLEALHRALRVKGTVESWRSLGSAPPWRDVRRLPESATCPALVIHGHNDPIVPLWAGEELARRLQADLQIIDDCGHFAPEEYPSQVLAMIQKFVERQITQPAAVAGAAR
jgi:pyruvate dehydrogenase E2 component (dihydrolipoamide acetyltransferase)